MNKKIIIGLIIVLAITIIGIYLFPDKNQEELPLTNKIQRETPKESTTNNNSHEIQNMKIEILKEGGGETAKNGNKVTVHYVGILENGAKFDSSIDRGTPFSFLLGSGQVIKGWDLGVLGMKIGEKRKITIPPELAYGDIGTPDGPIPPKATLIFEVELLEIN
ncbi:MAG: FKBP-type peptidyl-prolyl cis-trans isomerase [Patescibacteria group bacterium]|nr:FKBP-type peptidyl-prolyl cis-trans isomerase [Patescibacteria group bacterium]